MRLVLPAAALAAALALPAAPAHAASGVVLRCALHYRMSGVSSGTGDCVVDGTVNGVTLVEAPEHLVFSITTPAATCPLFDNAAGSGSGAFVFNFQWVRYGNAGIITATGTLNGTGSAQFYVTSPIGNPCGGPVEEQAVFTFGTP